MNKAPASSNRMFAGRDKRSRRARPPPAPSEPLATPDVEVLGRILAGARRQANIGQSELAQTLGKSAAYVHTIEAGRRRPDRNEFVEICAALQIDAITIFERYLNALSEEGRGARDGLRSALEASASSSAAQDGPPTAGRLDLGQIR